MVANVGPPIVESMIKLVYCSALRRKLCQESMIQKLFWVIWVL